MAARRGAAKKEACASQPQHAMSCATPETDAATIIRATKECVERIGPDLRYYTSAIAVDALLPFDKPQLPRFIHLLATGKATAWRRLSSRTCRHRARHSSRTCW